MKSADRNDNVLEQNVSTLLGSGGEAPRISAAARSRIRAALVERHGVEAPRRSPLLAIGLGLAATAAGALVVTRVAGGGDTPLAALDGIISAGDTTKLADGTTYIVPPGGGGRVEVLGTRHVRVEGAALLDVAPGKGTFVVETERGRIEVLGTRFYVNAESARTTAAVVRGAVKLASTDGEVTLRAGEQGIAELGHAPTRGPAPRLSHLVSWAAEARRREERTIAPLRNGTLFARDPNRPWVPESPLPITKLTVDITVEDQVARVALDQTFRNPTANVMEGNYRFAIPPDAALQRLAMYVNGTLMESAVVERMQGRRIYEDIVYRRLDPALLEWAGTGRLALRVYPLPPREDKRLILAYTQSLSRLYDDYTVSVPLPEVDLPVGELGFDVRVKDCARCEISSTSHAVTVGSAGADATVTVRKQNAKLGDALILRVRDPRRAPLVATATEGRDGYLMVRTRPDLAAPARAYRPRTWVILDDVSASRNPSELRAQTDVIDGFVRELDEEDRVAVVAFDVAARTKLPLTRVLDVDRAELRRALREEGGVGATDFSTALDAARALLADRAGDDATIVYVGDGVITSGPRNLDAVRGKLAGVAHFVGIGLGDGPDTQTLEALAAATAGYATTIDLSDDVGWRVFDLVAALNTPRVTGLAARLVDGSGAAVPSATAYVKTPQLADGEELELVAQLGAGAAASGLAIELTGTLGGAPWKQRIAVDTSRASRGGYLPRLWAQRHVAARLLAKHEPVAAAPCTGAGPGAKKAACPTEQELREARDEGIRKEVVALGKRHFLLSRHTSLIVLEDDAMYEKYGVVKGSGATWAPYATPAKIPVVAAPPAVPAGVAGDAELLRPALAVYSNLGRFSTLERGDFDGWGGDLGGEFHGGLLGHGDGRITMKRREMQEVNGARLAATQTATPDPDIPVETKAEKAKTDARAATAQDFTFKASDRKNRESPATYWALDEGEEAQNGDGFFAPARSGKKGQLQLGAYPVRLAWPFDGGFDDLTAHIPALAADATTAWRAQLLAAAGEAKTHAMDGASRARLTAARRALPTGVYRWGDFEIAIDDARRIGWRRTTQRELAETASFDGATWTRRYAELGLDVTRTLAEDDVALALAYLPLWIAEPEHYARWFEVAARGPREVGLSRTVAGKPELAYVLAFDDRDRLIALRDGNGRDLVAVTWGATGPTAARLAGDDLAVGFTAQPVTDAAAWAHGGAAAGAVVELPA
ncbi:MAG: VWA domain-containing protein, partial [Deltaproteobacteria bacterium]|nr:VWA domain-containing protein [Deltaproteobacteria bacterium]